MIDPLPKLSLPARLGLDATLISLPGTILAAILLDFFEKLLPEAIRTPMVWLPALLVLYGGIWLQTWLYSYPMREKRWLAFIAAIVVIAVSVLVASTSAQLIIYVLQKDTLPPEYWRLVVFYEAWVFIIGWLPMLVVAVLLGWRWWYVLGKRRAEVAAL